MPTRNINLTEHFDRFVEAEIGSGRFGNASEVVREGLRLIERRNREDAARLEWLRGTIAEGLGQLDRGEGMAFESLDDVDRELDRIGQEVTARRPVAGKRAKAR